MKRLAFNGVCRIPSPVDREFEEKPFRLFVDRQGERADFDFLNYSMVGPGESRRFRFSLELATSLVYHQWLDGDRVPHFSVAWVGPPHNKKLTYLSISTTDYEKINILACWLPRLNGELTTEAVIAYLDIKSQKILRDLFEEVRGSEAANRTPAAGQ